MFIAKKKVKGREDQQMETEKKRENKIRQTIENWARLPKWMQSIQKTNSSLATKLNRFFLVVILPINLLMILITGIMTRSYEDRMEESYSYQLGLYTKTAEYQFSSMEDDMRDFLSVDNLAILMRGAGTDSMMNLVRLNSTLSESKVWDTYSGMYYVWDHTSDVLSSRSMGEKYSKSVKNGLEESARNIYREEQKKGIKINQKLIQTGEKAYLLQEYDYPFFSIGILYDLEDVLGQFYDEMEERTGNLYIQDADGNLAAGITEDGFVYYGKSQSTESWSQSKYMTVSKKLGFGDYTLVHRTLRSEYMRGLRRMLFILYILCAICLVASPLLCLYVNHLVTNPIRELCLGMEEVEAGNLEYQMDGEAGSYQMDFLYYSFNHMIEELHRMVTESYEKEIQKLQTDAINIRLQVNQHMLLNSLNTVYSLSRVGKKEDAEEFILLLMNYFRYVLRQDAGLVTVKEEIQFVQDYLKLQKIRFPGSFHLVYNVQEETENLPIPQLLIQNFVENTVKYGLKLGEEIEILINIREEEDDLVLSICDTGNGMTRERAEKLGRGEIVEDQIGKHIGIWNCKRRLDYYYGDEQKLTITSSPGAGTQVWIKVLKEPLRREEATSFIRQKKEKERRGDTKG